MRISLDFKQNLGEIYLLDWGEASVKIVPHSEILSALQHTFNFRECEEYTAFLKGYTSFFKFLVRN